MFGTNGWVEEVKCLEQSDDITWLWLGGDVEDRHCDDMDNCYECWPLCSYCWHTCDPLDGICENDSYTEEYELDCGDSDRPCPTTENWVFVAVRTMDGSPPWFRAPYDEIAKCADANPYRPPTYTAWRAPMVLSTMDRNVYYPQALEALGVDSVRGMWRWMLIMEFLPAVPFRVRFRDARAPWRSEWRRLRPYRNMVAGLAA